MTSIATSFSDLKSDQLKHDEPGGRGFVWLIWSLMSLLAMGFVARYGTDVPVWDDENLVPALAGVQPITPAWLWAQANEHRLPLPKMILLAADRCAGNDIRAGMFLSVSTLAALAAGLVTLLGRFRGGSHAADAVIPILLLHPGHATNLLWSIQFAFVLPTALATCCLIAIAGRSGRPSVRLAWVAGLTMTCLPLSSGNGLVFVPALAIWLLGSALAEYRSRTEASPRRASGIACAALPGLLLTGFYFWGFQPGVTPEARGGVADLVRTAAQFLTGGVGMPASWIWPWSGLMTAGLLVVSLAFLGHAWGRRPEEHARIFGLLAFLAGVLSVALAVGWGRGWAGDLAGFQDRYVTLATPFWCWLVLVIRLYAPIGLSRVGSNLLFGLICCLAWPNTEFGLQRGRDGVDHAAALSKDIQRGMPPFQIIHRNLGYLHPSSDRLGQLLPILRAGRIGPFEKLSDDPPFEEIPVPVDPVHVSLIRWKSPTAEIIGVDPQVTFALPQPRYVAGIRIRYAHANPQGAPARFVTTWSGPGDRGEEEDRRYANWNLPTGRDRETTIWIDDTIEQFQIQPDNQPGTFRFNAITLLIPRKP